MEVVRESFPASAPMRAPVLLRISVSVRDIHTISREWMKYGNLCNKKCKHYRKFADNI